MAHYQVSWSVYGVSDIEAGDMTQALDIATRAGIDALERKAPGPIGWQIDGIAATQTSGPIATGEHQETKETSSS